MLVNGQIRNAQVEHVTSKPSAPGCAGQMLFDIVGKHLWFSDGTKWHLASNMPHFSYGDTDPLTNTTPNFLGIDTPSAPVTYSPFSRVEGGQTSGSPIDGYIAPFDGFLSLSGTIVEHRDEGVPNFARQGRLELEYYINGVKASTLYSNRTDAAVENALWENGSNEETFLVTNRAILEVKQGDLVQLFITKFQNGNGGAFYYASSLEGHYIEAFCEG